MKQNKPDFEAMANGCHKAGIEALALFYNRAKELYGPAEENMASVLTFVEGATAVLLSRVKAHDLLNNTDDVTLDRIVNTARGLYDDDPLIKALGKLASIVRSTESSPPTN